MDSDKNIITNEVINEAIKNLLSEVTEAYKKILPAVIELVKSDEFKAELKYRIQSTKYPQVPIGDLHSVPHYRCPNCHKSVKTYEDSSTYSFCHWCGQALDWSDIK